MPDLTPETQLVRIKYEVVARINVSDRNEYGDNGLTAESIAICAQGGEGKITVEDISMAHKHEIEDWSHDE